VTRPSSFQDQYYPRERILLANRASNLEEGTVAVLEAVIAVVSAEVIEVDSEEVPEAVSVAETEVDSGVAIEAASVAHQEAVSECRRIN
jgi:hypothetical protein